MQKFLVVFLLLSIGLSAKADWKDLDEGSYVFQTLRSVAKSKFSSLNDELESLPFKFDYCYLMIKGEGHSKAYKGLSPCLWEHYFESKDSYIIGKGQFSSGEGFTIKLSRKAATLMQVLTLLGLSDADPGFEERWDIVLLRPSNLSKRLIDSIVEKYGSDSSDSPLVTRLILHFVESLKNIDFNYMHFSFSPVIENIREIEEYNKMNKSERVFEPSGFLAVPGMAHNPYADFKSKSLKKPKKIVHWHKLEVGVGLEEDDQSALFFPTLYTNYLDSDSMEPYARVTRDISKDPFKASERFGALSFSEYGEFTDFNSPNFMQFFTEIERPSNDYSLDEKMAITLENLKEKVEEDAASKSFEENEFTDFDSDGFRHSFPHLNPENKNKKSREEN